MAFVTLENVYKRYHMGEVTINAADGMTFDIEKGEFAPLLEAQKEPEDPVRQSFDDMFKSIQFEREKLPTSAPVLSPSMEWER